LFNSGKEEEEFMDSILVTGATGNVGQEVVRDLLRRSESQAGCHPIAATFDERDAARARSLFGRIPTVPFDFAKPETFAPAFAGVDKLFLMRPPQLADVARTLCPAIDAAQAAGVKHIVLLSLLGVNPRVPHYQVEQKILASGLPYTFLRPSFFMQNLDTFYRDDIRVRDEIFVPAGKAKTSFIDVRDIGAVAGMALCEDGHLNRAYELTGSEALDYYEVAAMFSGAQGRRIRYTRPTPAEYAARQAALGVPEEFIQVMRMLYWTVRLGIGAKVTPELGELLGRPPITMAQYACDFAPRFAAATEAERAAARPLSGGGQANVLRPLVELLQ
jgi:uncharacterized protein YbjT (DUF2867 family)